MSQHIIKHDGLFLITDDSGNVPGQPGDAYGLYRADTRFLSRYQLTGSDAALQTVGHSSRTGDRSRVVLLVNGVTSLEAPRREMVIERERIIRDGLVERIRVLNRADHPCGMKFWIDLEADFHDMFEVRGMSRFRRGTYEPTVVEGDGLVRFAYTALDGVRCVTEVWFSPEPAELVITPHGAGQVVPGARATFVCGVGPKAEFAFEVRIHSFHDNVGRSTTVSMGAPGGEKAREQEPSGAGAAGRPLPAFAILRNQADKDWEAWRAQCAEWRTDNEEINAVLEQSVRDLRMLANDFGRGLMPVAGVPWYAVPFGRDSLITSLQALSVRPDLAAGTLRTLAGWQGQRHDTWRDEAPGKILHEMRWGEMARTQEVPFGPYYGSVDSTPLFLILAGEYWRWTGDDNLIRELLPSLEAALQWLEKDGDLDGDGYVEYFRRQSGGLDNQGWKDSGDAIVHRDGRLAAPPIALAEVQGYVYAARRCVADMMEMLGDGAGAAEQRQRAARLKEAFNRDFWVPETGFYALALDRDKRRVAAVTSNPGHCLWSGIVSEEQAARMAEVLLSPDVFSGYGVRTLAASEYAYHPLSYHRGTVWPHDNSLIALGLARYGQGEAAARIAAGLFAAAGFDPYRRLPELFGGYEASDDGPVWYPVACVPQAWAAAAPFMLLQALVGLEVDVPGNRVSLAPRLPRGINRVELSNLPFGRGRLRVTVERQRGHEFAWDVDVSAGPRPEVVVR